MTPWLRLLRCSWPSLLGECQGATARARLFAKLPKAFPLLSEASGALPDLSWHRSRPRQKSWRQAMATIKVGVLNLCMPLSFAIGSLVNPSSLSSLVVSGCCKWTGLWRGRRDHCRLAVWSYGNQGLREKIRSRLTGSSVARLCRS